MELLQINNITKNFTGHRALDDVSMTVKEGSIHGLLGPNGAGKTTLIRIVNHITAPDSGEVIFDGHKLTATDTAMMGYLPEERGLYKKMKVGEQAIFFARLKGLSRRDAERELKAWFAKLDILSWWDRKVDELSKGMAQKIQFIVTVLHRPKLLIFDEPFSGFDPINAALLRDEMLELNKQGTTIIFSTHNMPSAETVCSDITLLNKSHNILSGNLAEIKRSFGEGRMCFTLAKTDDSIVESISNAGLKTRLEQKENGTTLLYSAPVNNNSRALIEAVNNRADILSISPAEPSLEEIFITTVNGVSNTTDNNE